MPRERATEEEARTLLAKFGLGADDVLRSAVSLSPGERTRAGLALPHRPRRATASSSTSRRTTSTSRRSRSSKRELAGYDGTVMLVTHDRRFLEAFAPGRTIEL